LLLLLIAVGFFTLIERKVLAFVMNRKGPNKPSLIGLFVPFADAIKLLTKPFIAPCRSSYFSLYFACILLFILPAVLWVFVPLFSSAWSWSLVALSILVWISLSVFGLLSAGWGSNSAYSSLAGTRCLAQSISYEICLSTVLLTVCLISGLSLFGPFVMPLLFLFPLLIAILFVVLLAESNRSPFDFAEGESELVSGYNVEYSGSGFVVLFLSEYLGILFLCSLLSLLSLPCSFLFSSFGAICFAFLFIWVRGTLPRFRYDSLMYLCWKSLLPLALSIFLLFLCLYYLIFALKA